MATPPRTHMESEVLSQPDVWRRVLGELRDRSQINEICERITPDIEWLFIGCGSSYYIAQAAAATFEWLGLHARAVPASDLLLFPAWVLDHRNCPQAPVLISRSGKTSEIIQAAELLEKRRGIRTIGVTCSAGEPLEKIARFTLHTLAADEQSTVMTRSFTAMLLALQLLGARVAHGRALGKALELLPEQVKPVLENMHIEIRNFVQRHDFADYVVLGQGPLFSIAKECALKITECSSSYVECFHTLEFRHGPKSVVGQEVLSIFLLSDSGYEAEVNMLEEVNELGGATLAIASHVDGRVKRAADLAIDLDISAPEVAQLAGYVPCGQLIGLFTGLKKGLNPDAPRHLSRVVVLNSAV